jgi:hypothetical protein
MSSGSASSSKWSSTLHTHADRRVGMTETATQRRCRQRTRCHQLPECRFGTVLDRRLATQRSAESSILGGRACVDVADIVLLPDSRSQYSSSGPTRSSFA